MWGLIIGIALGGLLLLTAISAWRDGELAVGEHLLKRGELRYGVAVGVLTAVGVGSLGSAIWMGVQVEDVAPIPKDFGPFTMALPGDWSRAEDLGAGMDDSEVGAAAFAGPGGDVMITWRHAPAPNDKSLDELIEGLKQPHLAYARWDARVVNGQRIVDMEYPSPRGTVRGRVLAKLKKETLSWIVASCSHDGSPARCERTIASLRFR